MKRSHARSIPTGRSECEHVYCRGGVVALALGASACQTNENVAANGNADEDPICDCIVVDRDNPVLSEDVLLTNTPFGEQAKRLNDTKWGYTSFDTTLSVAGATGFDLYFNGHDSFSPSEKTGQGLLDSWPTSNGAWIPSSQQPASMPWEVHGVRVGQLISTVTASKLRADWKATLASNATRLQLHPDVIVVPIQAKGAGGPTPSHCPTTSSTSATSNSVSCLSTSCASKRSASS